MTEKRKARTFVPEGRELREFEFLDDALEFMGAGINESLNQLFDQVVHEQATVVLFPHDGQPPPRDPHFKHAPKEHRGAMMASGLVMINTMPSRDPVLVVDTGDTFIMVGTRPSLLASFLAGKFKQPVPAEPPPDDPATRWVFSLTPKGQLCRLAVGMGIAPGTAKA